MDTVGARLSRSSTRYGPVGSSNASFSGTVRKWRKAWAPLAGGGNGGGAGSASASAGMGPIGCPRGSKVVLLKWAPVNGAGADGSGKEVAAAATRRRYVPVRLLVLQRLGFSGCLVTLLRPCGFDLLRGSACRRSLLLRAQYGGHNVAGDRVARVLLG